EALYDKLLNRTTFLHHINDLQRGIYEAKQAISLFTEMCRGLKTPSGLLFDCSADDSACQIRADMIRHYLHYYSQNTQLLDKIDFYIEQLSTLQCRIPDIQKAISANLKVPIKFVNCPVLSQRRHTIGSFQEGFNLFIHLYQNENDMSTWDPNNILITIKFISYTFILHKYMKLSIDKAVLRYVHDVKHLGGYRVQLEFKEMKRCISMLSMSYLTYISSSIMPVHNFTRLVYFYDK
ncbi:10325_t:CDS:2, partial [Gigaspora margarita]